MSNDGRHRGRLSSGWEEQTRKSLGLSQDIGKDCFFFSDGKKSSWVQPRDRPGLLSSEKKKDLGPISEDIGEGRLSS